MHEIGGTGGLKLKASVTYTQETQRQGDGGTGDRGTREQGNRGTGRQGGGGTRDRGKGDRGSRRHFISITIYRI